MARDTSYYQLVEAIQTIVSQTTAAQVMSDTEIGEVIAVNPLQIRLDPKTVIPAECIVLTKATCLHSIDMDVDHITEDASGGSGDSAYAPHHHGYKGRKTYLVHNELVVGDKVILLRESGGQRYIALDRYYNPNRGCKD